MRPVCLIQPPVSLANRSPCLDDQQFGLGMLALAAWLEEHGIPTVGLHLPLALRGGADLSTLVAGVQRAGPLVIAIGLNWVHFSRGAIEIARLLRAALPGVPIVVGGQHASLFAAEIASAHADTFDAVIVGEAELPLLELCRSVADCGRITGDIAGLCLPDGQPSPPHVVADIDTLPLYSYSSLAPRPQQRSAGALNTARGACPLRCAYCIEPVVGRVQGRPRLALHSPQYIAEQIDRLAQDGIDRFTIQDGFFIGGDRLLTQLGAEIGARRRRPAHLNVFAHPDSFSRDGFAALAAAAERTSVDFGIETGSPAVARRVHRPMRPERVVQAVADAAGAGVIPFTWWLAGLPGDNELARAETRELLVETMRTGGIPRWVSPLVLLPRTPMHERSAEYGVLPRMRTFEDYSVFSETTLAEAIHFSDLVTHSTIDAEPEQLARQSRELRRFIADNFHIVESFYRRSGGAPPELAAVHRTIASSFF